MALNFKPNSSNRLTIGSDASIDNLNPGWWAAWAWWNSNPAMLLNIYGKVSTAVKVFRHGAGTGTAAASKFGFRVVRASTNCGAEANWSTFGNGTFWATGKWIFVAATYDTDGAASAQRIFAGSLVDVVTEASSYVAQSAGSGGVTSDAGGTGTIGNVDAGNASFPGYIGAFWVGGGAVLTLAEAETLRLDPNAWPASCKAAHFIGKGGNTGFHKDMVGVNDGTPNFTTVVADPPLWYRELRRATSKARRRTARHL